MDKTIVMAIKNNCYGDMSKTIVMAIWIKQFYGDTSKTIVMAIWIKQLLWRYG